MSQMYRWLSFNIYLPRACRPWLHVNKNWQHCVLGDDDLRWRFIFMGPRARTVSFLKGSLLNHPACYFDPEKKRHASKWAYQDSRRRKRRTSFLSTPIGSAIAAELGTLDDSALIEDQMRIQKRRSRKHRYLNIGSLLPWQESPFICPILPRVREFESINDFHHSIDAFRRRDLSIINIHVCENLTINVHSRFAKIHLRDAWG